MVGQRGGPLKVNRAPVGPGARGGGLSMDSESSQSGDLTPGYDEVCLSHAGRDESVISWLDEPMVLH